MSASSKTEAKVKRGVAGHSGTYQPLQQSRSKPSRTPSTKIIDGEDFEGGTLSENRVTDSTKLFSVPNDGITGVTVQKLSSLTNAAPSSLSLVATRSTQSLLDVGASPRVSVEATLTSFDDGIICFA